METQLLSMQLNSNLIMKRRTLGAISPRYFANVYLSNHCNLPFSKMHEEILALLKEITEKRNRRLAIAAPRGYAKSTLISLAYPLWCVLYGKENFVLIVSNTADQACHRLQDIKKQLETNPLLISDFPEICQTKKPKPWRRDRIFLANDAMISAYGAGQEIRGIKKGKDRPGLIICDDLEHQEQVREELLREKLEAWFNGTLLNIGHPATNFVVVGNVLHNDSLLANLIDPQKKPLWTGMKYKAVEKFSGNTELWGTWSLIFRKAKDFEDKTGPEAARSYFEEHRQEMLEGTLVIWPQREDYYRLMELRLSDGQLSFFTERQNEPLDPHVCIFKEENISFWDDEFTDAQDLIQSIGRYSYFYGACDPSLGRNSKGDYAAIVILLKDKRTEICYVIAADLLHCRPDDVISRIIAYAEMYNFCEFAVESNNFQQLMADYLRKEVRRRIGRNMNIRNLQSGANKQSRIASLEPFISQGKLKLSRKHFKLLEQLTQFPLAKNDDGPDALEMAMQTAMRPIIVCGGLQ